MEITVRIDPPRWLSSAWIRRSRPLLVLVMLFSGVSIVLASDRFVDVDGASVHHDDINRIAEAGITVGCTLPDTSGDILYCPDQAVTRAQMASFLARGLGVMSHAQFGTIWIAAEHPTGMPSRDLTFEIVPSLPANLLSGAEAFVAVDASLTFVNAEPAGNTCRVAVDLRLEGEIGTMGETAAATTSGTAIGTTANVSAQGSGVVLTPGAKTITVTASVERVSGSGSCLMAVFGDAIATYYPFGSQIVTEGEPPPGP